jgi:hypothetical protein
MPVKGAGDLLKILTTSVGIKPCSPCQKRQEWLNKALPNPLNKQKSQP